MFNCLLWLFWKIYPGPLDMRKKVIALFVSAFLCSSIASNAWSNLFYPYDLYPSCSGIEATAIGDVNSDGKNDVVAVTGYTGSAEGTYHVIVFLQNDVRQPNLPVRYTALKT